MRPEGPTAAQADALVKERKFIKQIPHVVDGLREYRMQAAVYVRSQPHKASGLVIMASVDKSPPGVPRPFPSVALEMAGRFRIRGLNYALRHDCPSGPIVYGWHEHIWTNEYEDHVVIKARPVVRNTDIRGLFNWGLEKWKIDVGEPRTKGGRHGRKK